MRTAISLACAIAALCAFGAPDQVLSYSRQRLFPGFDGKTCKIQPSIATDGKGTVLLAWQNLLLTGSDVFYGESMAKSTDGGKTFAPGVVQKIFADTWEGKIRTTYYGTVNYSKRNRRWYGLGAAQRYVNDKVPMLKSVDGRPATFPMYYTVDPEKGAFTSRHELQVPFKYARTLPFGQKLECDNGDLLVPFYVIPPQNDGNHKSYCVVTRCRFEGDMLKVVSAGTPLADDAYPRGIGEPSLAKLNGKYYLTLRTDVQGLWAESDDGGRSRSRVRGAGTTARSSKTTTRSSTGCVPTARSTSPTRAAARTTTTCSATARRSSWRSSTRRAGASCARPRRSSCRSSAHASATST